MDKRGVMDLECKIHQIQRSTRTLIKHFIPIHNCLRMNLRWYYVWHTKAYARALHWVVLVLYILSIPLSLIQLPAAIEQTKADAPTWTWVNPSPTSNNLNDIKAVPGRDDIIWAVGDYGTVVKCNYSYNSASWTDYLSGVCNWTAYDDVTSVNLKSIYIKDANNIWIAGDNGKIFMFNGSEWVEQSSGTTQNLRSIDGSGDEIWAVGGTAITHYNGSAWSLQTSGLEFSASHVNFVSVTSYFDSTANKYYAWTTGLGNILKYDQNEDLSYSWKLVMDNGMVGGDKTSNKPFVSNEFGSSGMASQPTYSSIYMKDKDNVWFSFLDGGGIEQYRTAKYNPALSPTWDFQELPYGEETRKDTTVSVSGNWSNGLIADGSGDGMVMIDLANAYNPAERKYYLTTDTWQSSTWNAATKTGSLGVSYGADVNSAAFVSCCGNGYKIWFAGDSGVVTLATTARRKSLANSDYQSTTFSDVANMGNTAWIAYNSGLVRYQGSALISAGEARTSVYMKDIANIWSTDGDQIRYNNAGNHSSIDYVREQWRSISTNCISGLQHIRGDGNNRVWASGVKRDATQKTYPCFQFNDNFNPNDIQAGWQEFDGTNIYYGAVKKTAVTSSTFWAVLEDTFNRGGDNVLRYKDGQWSSYKVPGAVDVYAAGDSAWLAVGKQIKRWNGSGWITEKEFSDSNVVSLSGANIRVFALQENGKVSRRTATATSYVWSVPAQFTGSGLTVLSSASDDVNYLVGSEGRIARYYYPSSSFADRLLVVLPGQSFTEGTPPTGTPSNQRVGSKFYGDVYAVDGNYNIDTSIGSQVRITTTDPNDNSQHTTSVKLSSGQGRIELKYRTVTCSDVVAACSGWQVKAEDIGGVLVPFTSVPFQAYPGEGKNLSIVGNASRYAGQPSEEIRVELKDEYDNLTYHTQDTVIRLTSPNSTSMRFGPANSGPWTISEALLPAGAHNNPSIARFYYLESSIGSPTLKVEESPSRGWEDAEKVLSISTGPISNSKSSFSCQSDQNLTIRAGEEIRCEVHLKNDNEITISSEEVELFSSRNSADNIIDQIKESNPYTFTTNSQGKASFTFRPTKTGQFTLTARDTANNIHLRDEVIINVLPGRLSSLQLSSVNSVLTAGNAFDLQITVFDSFSNLITDYTGTLQFSSTDPLAVLPEDYKFSFAEAGKHNFTDISLKTAGEHSLTIKSLETGISEKLSFQITSAVVDSQTSSISINKDKATADGKDKVLLTIKLTDLYGNPVSGKMVKVISDRAADGIEYLGSQDTNEKGIVQSEILSKVTGQSVITAIDKTDNITISQKVTIEFKAPTIVSRVTGAVTSVVETLTSTTIAKTTKGTIEAVAQIKEVLESSSIAKEVAKTITPATTTLATTALFPIVANVLSTVPQIMHFAAYLFTVLLEAVGIRRRRRPWGVVYDSITGKPINLAVVRIFDKNHKLFETRVSDFSGRFGFLVPKGQYYATVTKPNFRFPSKMSRMKAQQLSERFGESADIYLGQPITVESQGANINLNIPIDPIYPHLSPYLKIKMLIRELVDWVEITISYIAVPLLSIGSALSIFNVMVVTNERNILISLTYILLLLIYILRDTIRRRHYGVVYNSKTKKPVAGAVVSIYDAEYNTLRQTQVTDKEGRFTFLVKKGEYYLSIDAENYIYPSKKLKGHHTDGTYLNLYLGQNLSFGKPGYINVSIPLDKVGKE